MEQSEECIAHNPDWGQVVGPSALALDEPIPSVSLDWEGCRRTIGRCTIRLVDVAPFELPDRKVAALRRRDLRQLVRQISKDVERKPMSYWSAVEFPHSFTECACGAEIDVEIVLLEETDDYFHLGVSISDAGWLSQFLPVSTPAIVRAPSTTR